jgi:hypothetical protein
MACATCLASNAEGEAAGAADLEAGGGDVDIVARAAAVADLLKGLVEAQGRPARPVRGRGFDRVGHGEDARLDEDAPSPA